MKRHARKVGLALPILSVATLAGSGCGPSLAPTTVALAQTAINDAKKVGVSPSKTLSPQIGTDHEFVFRAEPGVKAVSVVGTFNGWNKTANPMRVDADGITYRASLPLKYGRYLYKFAQFLPDQAEKWVVDPKAPRDETDKVNDNSILTVTPAGYNIPPSPSDGQTARGALFHSQNRRDVNYEDGRVTLFLRARPGDLRALTLKSASKSYPMRLVRSDDLFAYHSGSLPWSRQRDLSYSFELADGDRTSAFGPGGLAAKTPPFVLAAQGFRPYLLTPPTEILKMNGPLTTQSVAGPDWAKNQPIYEVNLDLYKFPKGTALRQYEKHLPVLKEMGVGILWFMPLHPRGEKKGFGSPYSVRDYAEINPDLGTKAEFKSLVERAHQLGLRVIMDWVPNHTSWDNPMIEAHPEFYVKDAKGEIVQAQTWADVAQLDYGQPGKWNQPLWNQMRDDMAFWVREFGIDGYRADVAGSNGKVPIEFWNWLRPQLEAIKPVFMLAEADNAGVHSAFDMSYEWGLPPILWDICAGRKPATAIDEELRKEALKFPDGAVMMRFLDNHDWHPHADWGWGQGPVVDTSKGLPQVAPLMILCATLPGKPLLYNGQEMSFLKTDPPADAGARTNSPVYGFYRSLLGLYRTQPALVEGNFSKIASSRDDKIYAFTRQSGQNRVLVVVNLSDQIQNATLKSTALAGQYRDGFDGAVVTLAASPSLQLAPWGYRVYVSNTK